MHRIAFLVPNLSGGGAARVAAILASEWVAQGHCVDLLTFEDLGMTPVYPIDARVRRHQLAVFRSSPGLAGFTLTNAERVRRVRQTLKAIQPTAVIAFLLECNVVAALAARGLGLPVIVAERNHPAHDRISRPKAIVRRHAYRMASRLVVQTGAIARWFEQHLGLASVVIPNPMQAAARPPAREQCADGKRRMVSLGRLEPQKGFDRLIDAFAIASRAAPGWQLSIYGDGEERAALAQRIAGHGLAGAVRLAGTTRNPAGVLAAANLYVHAARYEGFPNAVIEALAAGCCVVATDCPGATGELLQGGRYGVLAPDAGPRELAVAMLGPMRDEALRAGLAGRAPEAVAHLEPGAIARRWIEVVEGCCDRVGAQQEGPPRAGWPS
jgi:glycosyltransferase involved in cell wall biosynthesis